MNFTTCVPHAEVRHLFRVSTHGGYMQITVQNFHAVCATSDHPQAHL